MKIIKEQTDWIKLHQGMLRQFINLLKDDYFNRVVDEPDLQRKEVLSLLVKELRNALTAIDNICNLKDKKQEGSEFTGV